MLRFVTLCLFIVSALFAGSNAYFNELRASTGCGLEYSWVFSHEKGIKLATDNFMPIMSLGVVAYLASMNKLVRVLSVYVAIVMLFFSSSFFFPDYFSGYAPCDRKGDESSFAMYLVSIFLWVIWLLWSLVLFFISSQQKGEKA